VILACFGDHFTVLQTDIMWFSITTKIQSKADNQVWTLIAVYGPQGDSKKIQFPEELRQIKQMSEPKWLIMRDFNLIYRSCDKSNGIVNRRLMNSFRSILDELEVKEVHLHGRRYTWSSGTTNPTQTKIDHVFMTQDWELANPNCHMQALGSSISDHCPMLMSFNPFHWQYIGFRFEAW
jgi:endonuclease/exonuclease/phosphatase family metal-dependent hydrolase